MDRETHALVLGLAATELEEDSFGHLEHVRAAWGTLRRDGLAGSLEQFPRWIQAFAAAAGVPEKFHATMTWALIVLIHERMTALPDKHTWEAFRATSPRIMGSYRTLLLAHYTAERLDSPLARETFILPERCDAAA